MNTKKKPAKPYELNRQEEIRDDICFFWMENWPTIVTAAATTIVFRLILGW